MGAHNKAVNSDAFFVLCAHYKCAGYGWRYAGKADISRRRSVVKEKEIL
jgi:hypothetical protein